MTMKAADTGVDCREPWSCFSESHAGLAGRLQELAAGMARGDPGGGLARAARSLGQEMLRHHEEEEKHLFPAVLQSAAPGSERERIRRFIDGLAAAHRRLEAQWEQMLADPSLRRLRDGLEAFDASYLDHAHSEEEDWLPLSRSILQRNPHHVLALGAALHMRRAKPPLAYW